MRAYILAGEPTLIRRRSHLDKGYSTSAFLLTVQPCLVQEIISVFGLSLLSRAAISYDGGLATVLPHGNLGRTTPPRNSQPLSGEPAAAQERGRRGGDRFQARGQSLKSPIDVPLCKRENMRSSGKSFTLTINSVRFPLSFLVAVL